MLRNKKFLSLFVVSVVLPCVYSNTGTCSSTINRFMYLKLGLPESVNDAYVSGYLPVRDNWTCSAGFWQYHNAHAIFMSYYSTAMDFAIGVGSTKSYNTKWGLYFWQKNNGYRAVFRICKWDSKIEPSFQPSNQQARECLINKEFYMGFGHAKNQIFGVSWSGNRVTLHTLDKVVSFFVEGADTWDYASYRCANGYSCAHQVVYTPVTLKITTVPEGIRSYDLCTNCSGFPEHVFAVLEGGEIPPNFDFTNWFYLTNASSPVSGRVVGVQPLQLLCLWPIPALLGTATDITFDRNGTSDVRCNGFSSNSTADAMRFSLNFTDNGVFAKEGAITLKTVSNTFIFSCSNSSTYTSPYVIPFGHIDQPYYCFTTFYANETAGTTVTSFVGMLPPIVREFVITKLGDVYLNGYRIFSVGEVVSVNFNISSTDHRDFWTVAFVKNAEVMLDIEDTYIKQLLYCNNPVNVVKCQQLKFVLEDGFYSYVPASEDSLPRTIVRLPRFMTHSFINFTILVSFYFDDGKQDTPVGSDFYECATCAPKYYRLAFVEGFGEALRSNTTSICVSSASFTTRLFTDYFGTAQGVRIGIEPGSCPFGFDTLNNYLAFGSLCFSTVPNGGCTMNIVTQGPYGQPHTFAVLYVSYTEGDNIIGVPQSNIPAYGVADMSQVYFDTCTTYTIYGMTGRGIITRSNNTFITGLYYTSNAGNLLAYKNSTTGIVYNIYPCQLAGQVAVISDNIVGMASSTPNVSLDFNVTVVADSFYYLSNSAEPCDQPVLTYAGIGICADGSITNNTARRAASDPISPVISGNISVPTNFTFSVQVEYIQLMLKPVTVDCSVYVCNGNPRCLQLLAQYASACRTIEQALQLSARLESVEVNSMISISQQALDLGVIDNFNHDFNLTNVLPANVGGRSAVEDLLFDKVVTNGLGTVDADYKECASRTANTVAEVGCVQYYNGIMVLPGVVDQSLLAQYSAALTGAMVLGGITAAAAVPFSIAVQSRLNYLALQTDVLQRNQQQLANSFNAAMGNITEAFGRVNDAIEQTSHAISTVAQALDKVQNVVNDQGMALSQLTKQLASNFQAISSSIEDLYNRLDRVEADQQVDRLITGRLAALNAFVAQQLTKYTDVRASRQLAQEKINECVKSQSFRYGFCGNGTHVFSVVNAAPDGMMFFHSVLLPTAYMEVAAFSGLCVDGRGFVLREVGNVLFEKDGRYLITARRMFEPRLPQTADFVQISGCDVVYLNVTRDELPTIIPDYVDVNGTVEDILSKLPNRTSPELDLDIFNATYLNLTSEIADLTARSESLKNTTLELKELIANINATLVDLEWLNRVETYIKWPWWVWLIIVLVLILFTCLMLFCCCSTGCCGIFSCLASSCGACCDIRGTKLQRYEAIEKVHVQ
uniref:Spike glycoprotein n=1 Tax=Bat Coronavirus MsGX16 TaxID=3018864 RepID=A0AA49ECU8_9NIDO|nr:spike glycoprotein [Bat Coronavirus MsGX16]